MIVKKLFPDEKLIVTEYFDVHQDWEIPIPGFFIIAARRKIPSIGEFTEEEAREFIELLCTLRKGMRQVLNIEKVYLFQREDTSHERFHLWVMPRHEWMEKFGKRVESIRPIIDHAEKNMVNENNLKEVRSAAKKMREFMKNNFAKV